MYAASSETKFWGLRRSKAREGSRFHVNAASGQVVDEGCRRSGRQEEALKCELNDADSRGFAGYNGKVAELVYLECQKGRFSQRGGFEKDLVKSFGQIGLSKEVANRSGMSSNSSREWKIPTQKRCFVLSPLIHFSFFGDRRVMISLLQFMNKAD